MANTNGYLLTVEDLKTYFPVKRGLLRRTIGYVRAVDGISFGIEKGQTLGLVGESGCGKTTVAQSCVRLVPATAGKVVFEGTDVLSADRVKLRQIRRQISLIFQDPYGSLNPRMTVGNIVGEPLRVHKNVSGSELSERIASLLSKVGLSRRDINRYPHEFSGGQRQRIGVARALAVNPALIVADEAVSALDVSIQAQIINLMVDLQERFGLAYLFITHDLSVVHHISDWVAVMYVGKLVEMAQKETLFFEPRHPYTEALLSSLPQPDPDIKLQRIIMKGDVADPANRPSGCCFHPRCLYARQICRHEEPPLVNIARDGEPEHLCACHSPEELSLSGVAAA